MSSDSSENVVIDGINAAIAAREELRIRSLLDEDWGSFSGLLTDDVVHVHGSGIVHGKADLLAYNRQVVKFAKVERNHLNIRPISFDCAIMTGPMTSEVLLRKDGKKMESTMFVTQVWVCDSGEWRIASFHAVRTGQD